MTRSLFCESALLPDGWHRHVRIGIREGLIEAVSPDAAPGPADHRLALIVPGMPNVHSHAFQRALAGLAEQTGPRGTDDFWSWRERMYGFLARLGPDDLEAIAAYAYADMLEAGFTSVGEFHYLHRSPAGTLYSDPAELALRHVAAAEATGIGLTLLPVFYEASDFGGAPPTAAQRRFITDLDTYGAIFERARDVLGPVHTHALRRVGIAPHSLRAVTPAHLAELLRRHRGEVVHIHAAEQVREVDACLAWSGRRPVQWLLEHAAVEARWCIVHATHLAPPEIAELAGSGAVVGACPVTEANLGDGTFPAAAYLRAGGRLGIGTDANVAIDAAGELRQLEYAQRLHSLSRNALAAPHRPSTGGRIHEIALAGGAQALGQQVGAIAAGYRADLVALDASHPDLAGRSGDVILDTWIFSGGRALIREVIAAGETVVIDRRHRDRGRIDAAYRSAVSRLLDRR